MYSIVMVFSMYQYELAIGSTCVPSILNPLLPPSLSHPSRLLLSPSLSSLCHTADSHWLFILFHFFTGQKKGGNKDNFTIYQVYNIQIGQFLRSRTIFTIETRQNPNSGCNEQNHPQQPAGDMMENVIRLQLLHYRLRPAQHSLGPGGLQPLFPAACWFLLP